MDNRKTEKISLRKKIREIKNSHLPQDFKTCSDGVFALLEQLPVFQRAQNVLIYNNLPDEIHTLGFVRRWMGKKDFFFPVVIDDNLVFRKYHSATKFTSGSLNVPEPDGEDLSDYSGIDLIIVPGVAFDTKFNRLGRGKGYYDRFLQRVSAVKIGVCFDFQLLDEIPADIYDVKMDYIISEKRKLDRIGE